MGVSGDPGISPNPTAGPRRLPGPAGMQQQRWAGGIGQRLSGPPAQPPPPQPSRAHRDRQLKQATGTVPHTIGPGPPSCTVPPACPVARQAALRKPTAARLAARAREVPDPRRALTPGPAPHGGPRFCAEPQLKRRSRVWPTEPGPATLTRHPSPPGEDRASARPRPAADSAAQEGMPQSMPKDSRGHRGPCQVCPVPVSGLMGLHQHPPGTPLPDPHCVPRGAARLTGLEAEPLHMPAERAPTVDGGAGALGRGPAAEAEGQGCVGSAKPQNTMQKLDRVLRATREQGQV